ncbi:MAG: DUF4392 domain-containing protein, partial [Deltaproteobacteria bacterium]|nr:DUF4392 domain-containing protein [Deltaproteobacteria bacterium]
LEQAARTLSGAQHVLILSGFYLATPRAGETDGPPGAKTLGDALSALGARVSYVTDDLNLPLFMAMGLADTHRYHPGVLEELAPSHVLSIERPGRAADGRYYSMRGEDISRFTAPLDELLIQGRQRGLPTVAIGDGGNEAGMGNVAALVRRDVPHGQTIACVVESDHLIVCGVSNFGAYGLVAALEVLNGRALMPTPDSAARDVEACVAGGGHCGQTYVRAPFVGGLPLEATRELVAELTQWVRNGTS